MATRFAHSTLKDIDQAQQELQQQLGGSSALLVFFCSSSYPAESVAQAMHKLAGGGHSIGCQTAGEIFSGKMLEESIVAVTFDQQALKDCSVAVVEDIHSRDSASAALDSLGQHFGTSLRELAVEQHVGLILSDGLSTGEEKVMEAIGDLCNVPFVGGSSGDDVKFVKSRVFCNGKVYGNASVLAMLKPAVPYEIVKTQSFDVLEKRFRVTAVDEAKREVKEFDNRPAAEVYAEALGVEVDQLAGSFMKHPVGLMVDGEPYVRSPQQVVDGSVVFYCRVQKGMELALLKSRDIVAETGAVLKQTQAKGSISALVNFHCILRTLELKEKSQLEAYGQLFSDIPTVGFSTYGESYIGHINQTSTMLVLY